MSRTIYVPEDDDELLVELVPQLHAIAKSKMQARRASEDAD